MLLLIASSALAVDAYRWRDAQGSIHFGDRPPNGIASEKITIRTQPSPLSPIEATQQVERLRETEAARNPAEGTETTAGATADAPDKRDRCARAQWALSALETARPVYRDERGMYRIKRPRGQVDPYTGERVYLDDPTRAQELVSIRKLIQDNCGAQPTDDEKARIAEEILAAEHCEAAAAELADLTRAGRGQDIDLINARREYLAAYCAK
ncbi:MAG: DUF4124 domain-containing protein [Gammaproteobacteria bacterium]